LTVVHSLLEKYVQSYTIIIVSWRGVACRGVSSRDCHSTHCTA
jgi:hypothetical protein